MTERSDGGPAFPRPLSESSGSIIPSLYGAQHGMSLRDWFAGQALSGLLASGLREAGRAATDAYEIADAMLNERGANDD